MAFPNKDLYQSEKEIWIRSIKTPSELFFFPQLITDEVWSDYRLRWLKFKHAKWKRQSSHFSNYFREYWHVVLEFKNTHNVFNFYCDSIQNRSYKILINIEQKVPDTQDSGEMFYKPHVGDSGSGLHSQMLLKVNLRKTTYQYIYTKNTFISENDSWRCRTDY